MIKQVLRLHSGCRSLLIVPSRIIIREHFSLGPQHMLDITVMYIHLLKSVQQEYSDYDYEEAASGAYNIFRAHLRPFPEQDRGRYYHQSREKDVINGRHDRRVEQVERFIQIIHLYHDAEDNAEYEDPR